MLGLWLPPCVATCAQDIVPVQRGASTRVAIARAGSSTFFLAFGMPGSRCTAIPGINGMLSMTPVTATMLTATGFVRIYASGGQPCFSSLMTVDLPIPAGLPSGARFSMQALVQEAGSSQFGLTNSLLMITN